MLSTAVLAAVCCVLFHAYALFNIAFLLYSVSSVLLLVAWIMGSVALRWREKARVQWMDYLPFLLMAASSAVTAGVGVLPNYVVAFFISPFSVICLYALDDLSLVKYPLRTDRGRFLISRMQVYALLRAALAFCVRLGLPIAVDRVACAGAGVVETGCMAYFGLRTPPYLWYDFPVRSADFAAYAVVKTAVLLSLPLVEEVLLARLC